MFIFFQDTEIVHSILATVINLADIEFMESDKGNAEIKDAAPYCHGIYYCFSSLYSG